MNLFQISETLTAIAAALSQITVQVRGRKSGAGSGVIWQPDGLIITNAHVVTGDAIVELWDGRIFPAQVVRHDSARDLAALQIEAADLPAARLGADSLRVGEVVLALGNPLGTTRALTTGIICAAPAEGGWIQADIQLAPGNSGGLLANAQGQVIGINSMIVNGLGLAIPSAAVQQFLQANPLRLGVTLQPVRVKRQLGFLVLEVAIGSLAAAIPLQVGDILFSLDGSFHHINAIPALLDSKQPGDTVQLEFLRGGQVFSRSVRLQPAGQEAA